MDRGASTKQQHEKDCFLPRREQPLTPNAPRMDSEESPLPSPPPSSSPQSWCSVTEANDDTDEENHDDDDFEIISQVLELDESEYFQPIDNHHPKSDQKQEVVAGSSSQGCSPSERILDLPESRMERSNSDLEEHVQLFQSRDEMNSEIPELDESEYFEPTDHHHPKSDQKQEVVAGSSSQGCSPSERILDSPESRKERSNSDLEEHVQLFQSRDEMNSEMPELTESLYLEPTDHHHPKSDQKQEVVAGSSSQGCGPSERILDSPESRKERSNSDLEEHVQLFQSRDEMNSEMPELTKEKHLQPTDNHPKSDLKQKVDTGHPFPGAARIVRSYNKVLASLSNQSDSSDNSVVIQPGRLYQHSHDKNMKRMISFGEDLYICGKWEKNQLVELHSCEFTHPHSKQTVYIRKQQPGYLFTFDENDFIARVSFDKLEEINFDQPGVVNIKKNILEKLILTEIIKDELINYRDDAYMHFIELVQDRSGKTVNNLEYAEDIFQLSGILEKYRNSPTLSILSNIVNNRYISSDLKHSCRQLISREKALDARSKGFSQTDQFRPKDVLLDLYKSYKSAINNHKTSLLDKCFSSISLLSYSMNSNINALSEQQVFYISNQDINLFCDLYNEMNEQVFSIFLHNLQSSLFNNVKAVNKHKSVKELAPLTHPIYFHLCKHFHELVLEISGKTNMSVNDLLGINESGIVKLVKSIKWPALSPLNYSLEQQYRFSFKLMKHFEPVYSTKRGKFVYQFKLSNIRSEKSWWDRCKAVFVSGKTPDIPEERLVWMYVLDNAIADLFLKKSEKFLELFTPLLEGYMAFIHETEYVHHESFRIVTYNTVRFIARAIPYFSEGASEIDLATLANQILSIKNTISHKQFIDFRDLVDVYNEYWKNRETLVENIPDKFPYGKFKDDMEGIRKKLYNIVNTVLSKDVKPQVLIKYFRSFNEFLEDLSAVEFSWFIKEISDLTEDEVVLVNNDKKSYMVLDPENFIKKHANIPGHYIIEIIDDLLNSLSNLFGQNKWPTHDNINAASELVSAIKKSFLYLKEQPNYISFDTFKEESTMPFSSVVENSSSYKDFMKRVDIVGESFWYLRKQDEIDITKALMLYRKENEILTTETEETLIYCYKKYLEKFNSYIELTCKKNYLDKIEFITTGVTDQLQCNHFTDWIVNFKQETLPELLAGVAAVWSVQASKDIAHTRKMIKPHCIQVLSILLLLSVDKDYDGVDNHFTQILTGQGKSLVLGLIATLLALAGHKIRIVCYSEYLATRDQNDFHNFFRMFGIEQKISYGTFDDMALEILQPVVNDERQCLANLIEKRILHHSTGQCEQLERDDRRNTILLIDEVDVFFSSQFYGNRYSACRRLGMPALADIQEYIWEMANKSNEKSIILNEVEEFIKKRIRERNEDFNNFKKFLIEPGKYYLLTEEADVLVTKEYTNQSFYEEHLNQMIGNAINVASNDLGGLLGYKINDYGIITLRKNNGHYSSHVVMEYYNVFNYFKLKKVSYSSQGFMNYGYFGVSSGMISYAKLPQEYPLILGVSGTLNTLNDHEREVVINSYNIHENSLMPSYFGNSNLKFHVYNDFICEPSEDLWLTLIYSHAEAKIRSERSVIIFFDRDVELDKFVEKFRSKFDRLHKLDENTEEGTKEKYIREAGIAKTVTLATRSMGRGVDYKSSVAVEKNGGVHVIQTFFSLDIKEEAQVKGRTARKDNKGSYELIVCKIHLINNKLLRKRDMNICYNSLSRLREKMMEQQCSKNEVRIKKMDDQHMITMEFLQSFFTSKCSTQIEEPSEESTEESSEESFEEPPEEPPEELVVINDLDS